MKRLVVPTLLVLVAAGRAAGASSAPATCSDIRDLRAQVELLDESMRSVDPSAPEARGFGAVGAAGAIVATKGDEVELPPGTEVVVRLERPVDLARIERE